MLIIFTGFLIIISVDTTLCDYSVIESLISKCQGSCNRYDENIHKAPGVSYILRVDEIHKNRNRMMWYEILQVTHLCIVVIFEQ
jgi:hypothetical protein